MATCFVYYIVSINTSIDTVCEPVASQPNPALPHAVLGPQGIGSHNCWVFFFNVKILPTF